MQGCTSITLETYLKRMGFSESDKGDVFRIQWLSPWMTHTSAHLKHLKTSLVPFSSCPIVPQYSKLIYSTTKKPNNPIRKLTKDLTRHFSKEDMYMANKHMTRCSTWLVTRKMQIKTIRTLHTHIRMAVIKKARKQKTKGVGEGAEKLELLCIADGNVKRWSCRKRYGGSS